MMPRPCHPLLAVVFLPVSLVVGGEPAREHRDFFEKRIRPVLVEHCQDCHSAGAKKIGGRLLLDSAEGWSKGGESGRAIVPGKPEESLLLHALRWENDLEMPPKTPLPESVIADFERWIAMGAPDPRDAGVKVSAGTGDGGRIHAEGVLWAYSPPRGVSIPEVGDKAWPRGPIDRLVLSAMETRGLRPAPEADIRSLARRLSFDLTGLPPTPEEVTLLASNALVDPEAALAGYVDSLLASPHFGERWGRHWLDVARYAESNGNDGLGRNPTFPHAWRYRDYVIDAFNRDLPYDRFVTEQLAGDLLGGDTPVLRDRRRVATAFLALGAKPAKAMNENFDMDVVADQIEVVSSGLLGLSVGCARCHDHKTDPIPTRDYYAMAGFFTSTETMWGVAANEKLTAPPTDLHVLEAAPRVPPPFGFVETVLVIQSNTGVPLKPPPPKWEPGTPLAMGVRDREKPADCKINLKGESKKLGETVPRGFLSAVEMAETPRIEADSSGRLELARWITDPENPFTARVMVNRIWLHLFGEALVQTPDDFGVSGARPTHPALLDHLALRFVAGGWSVKRLVREIVLSKTYRQSSSNDPAIHALDPGNHWLTRHERRRLDAESLRDAILRTSGRLDPRPAEGSIIRHRDILVNLAGNLHEDSDHRSVYLCYLRHSPPPEIAAFDLPEFTSVTGRRESNTMPGQALYLYNNPFVLAQSAHFAAELGRMEGGERDRVVAAFRRAFLREPGPGELAASLDLIAETARKTGSREMARASFCQALFAASEFRYLD